MPTPAERDTSFQLDNLPKEKEYEEFISAYLQCDGYYLERNIIAREVKELLELDILITKYEQASPKPILIEIKSGKWGAPDAFKLRGWLDFLKHVDQGILIAQKPIDELEYYQRNFSALNVQLIVNQDLEKTHQCLGGLLSAKEPSSVDIQWWRFSYWIERKLLAWLKKEKTFHWNENKKEGVEQVKRFSVLDDYYFKINSTIFFTPNILDRLYTLYRLFQNYPRLTAKCGNEMIGNNFDDDVIKLDNRLFNSTFYNYKLNDIAISTFVEYISKLAILKCAVDYILLKKEGVKERVEGGVFMGYDMSFISLPNHFESTLDELSQEPYYHLYPVFWQWFIYMFGGFILLDIKDREYELMSEKTGIPVDQIDNALGAFNTLFPGVKWFYTNNRNNIKALIMFPMPLASIGANYRRCMYTESKTYEELDGLLEGSEGIRTLTGWHMVGYDLLSKKL